MSDEMKKCPFCAEMIKNEAIICRFCNHDLRTGKPISSTTDKDKDSGNVKPKKRFGRLSKVLLVIVGIVLLYVVAGKEDATNKKTSLETDRKPPRTIAAKPVVSHQSKSQAQMVKPHRDTGIPKYVIHDKKISEASVKAQVEIAVIVKERAKPEGLKKLLRKLYRETSAMTGFKYYRHPTNIYIWVYSDKEKAGFGAGEWLAWLCKG